ncbi:uncharacterized protein E5676_scaffold648G00820 [Cucumis melo var. makuwa]|uniref:Uncharacterized protein n=1 Tax=Cucumis melo var. makuwa TaxID=1194695 RepID=A0A5A7U231_CUCMM|nr:uncharacterized protein E6C27_scaffold115G001240 [Cucumis melo var. makuwa]TYK08299.1 uncharacterized protein E5676_scaffold648G00820 [Cucumis melo var. makuwa]
MSSAIKLLRMDDRAFVVLVEAIGHLRRLERSNRTASSFGEVALPSAIQLLLGDDRAFSIRSIALVGAIGHLLRLERSDRASSSFRVVTVPLAIQLLLGTIGLLPLDLPPWYERSGTFVVWRGGSAVSDPNSTRRRSGFFRQIHRLGKNDRTPSSFGKIRYPGRSNRTPSSFGDVTIPSTIQLLLGDDRTFAVRFTTLVEAIHRPNRRNRAPSSFGEVTSSSVIQLLLGDDWAFVIRSIALLGAIEHSRRASSSAIQLLLEDDRVFVIESTVLEGAIGHPRYIFIYYYYYYSDLRFFYTGILLFAMVYFVEYSDSTERCLIILKDENQSLESGVILLVREEAFENITDSQIPKDNFILLPKWSKEHSVFKVASLMAEGYTFSLVIPVLANIYSSLRQIHDSTSSLGHSNACFPIHYVHGWLALYFNTHYKAPTSLRGPCMVEFSDEVDPLWLLNLIVLIALVGNLDFIKSWYDLDEKIPKADLTNARYHWMIYVHENTLSQVYLHVPALHPSNHITLHYKEQLVEKTEEGTKCLVATSTPSAKFKFPTRSGADNVRKDLHILTTGKRLSTHTEDSQSNNDDRHWKRPKRPKKQSIDDEKPPIDVPDVPQFLDITSPMSSLGDHVLQIEGTTKSTASPEVLSTSDNSKTPIDNLVFDLRRKTAITLWESLRQKIICTPFERTLRLNENRILEETSTVQHRLTRLSAKEAKLEAKLKVVRIESSIIFENKIKLKQKQHEISKTCEEIDKLECAPIVGDADEKMLLALRESLEKTL